jgi:transposase
MGRGIILSDRQWDELDQLRFTTSSADIFRNCLIVLKSDSAETIPSIAEQLGCAPETVKRVRRLYRQGGIEALRPQHSPGRPSKATPVFLRALRQAVTTGPLTLGYGFSTWSAARLAEHLAGQTGIRFSPDQLRRLLHREGFSVQRPKHTMKGRRDEVAYAKAKKQLRRLKKKP